MSDKTKIILKKILGQVAIITVTIIATALITRQILLSDVPEILSITDTYVAEASENRISDPLSDPMGPEIPIYPTFEELEPDLPDFITDDEKLLDSLKALLIKHPRAAAVFERADEYPEELLKFVCVEEEILDFAIAYPDAKNEVTGGFTDEEIKAKYPLLTQFDTRWAFYPYGSDIIAVCGCAPTAVSMIALTLAGNTDATPDVVADYCMEKNLYVEGSGTDWSLFSLHCNEFGIRGRVADVGEANMKKALDKGHILLLSVKPGDFTQNGHIILIVDHKNGKFIVRDPSSRARSEQLWTYETLASQMKAMWEFESL